LRDLEERIGATSHPNLPGQLFDTFFIRNKRHGHIRQRRRRFGTFPARTVVTTFITVAATAIAFSAELWTAKFIAAKSIIGTGTIITATAAIRTRAASGAGATAIAMPALGFNAFLAGELVEAIGFSLAFSPCGLKQTLQIES
jgi:hypothetical protein